MNDVFNNPSNDYVNPGLAPCAGNSDDQYFEFLPKKEAGIISGSQILANMNLGDISVPVDGWVQEKKTIQGGEVIYIPGLDKGLSKRTQKFNIPIDYHDNQEFFMMVDMSINYHYNFRYYINNIDASSNYNLNLNINDSLNIELGKNNIKATSSYDPSAFIFEGDTDGYDFNITNMVLTIIDASLDENSPFPSIIIDGERIDQTYNLTEDTSSAIPATKYPNGAMQGIIMTATYPLTTCAADDWLYFNNVESPLVVHEPTNVENFISNVRKNVTVEFDPSIKWGPFVLDNSILVHEYGCFNTDISIGNVTIIEDPSWNYVYSDKALVSQNETGVNLIDCSIYQSDYDQTFTLLCYIEDSSMKFSSHDQMVLGLRSEFSDSSISNSVLHDSSLYNTFIEDGSFTTVDASHRGMIFNSKVNGTYINDVYISNSIIDNNISISSSLLNSNIYDSSIQNYIISDTSLNHSITNNSLLDKVEFTGGISNDSSISNESIIIDASIVCSHIEGSYVLSSDLNYSIAKYSVLYDSLIYKSILNDSSIVFGHPLDPSGLSEISNIVESNLNMTSIDNAWIRNSEVSLGYSNNLYSKDTVYYKGTLLNSEATSIHKALVSVPSYDASLSNNVFNDDMVIMNSTLENAIFNAHKLYIDASNNEYMWIIEGIDEVDSSLNRISIDQSNINDSVINNAVVKDSSIYTTYIQDSSLIRCTIYNSDPSTSLLEDYKNVDLIDCKIVQVNMTADCSVVWDTDSSIFYNKYSKDVNVGMNGCGNELNMSGGEYLDWVNTNDKWNKFGPLLALISAPDVDTNSMKNLITGMYVFNPHSFPVQVEYMMIN